MSDIGSIFSTGDIVLMILVACAPGLLGGAIIGAFKHRSNRILGSLVYAIAGFVVFFIGWWIYLSVIK